MNTGKQGCGCGANAPAYPSMVIDAAMRERIRRKLAGIRGAGGTIDGLGLFGASARPGNSVTLAAVRITAANGERLALL